MAAKRGQASGGRRGTGGKPRPSGSGLRKPARSGTGARRTGGRSGSVKKSAGGTPRTSPRNARVSKRRRLGVRVTALPATREADGRVRLNRYLAMAGICSRRAADEMIAAGRVEVNGERTKQLGQTVDPEKDQVEVDGEAVQREKTVYVLLNKPKGVVCTNARHEQKPRVIDLLPTVRGRLFTVGRLDLDSEGLLLATNDGDFAQRMTHPSHGVPKVYAVLVRGKVGREHLAKARGGVWLAEGPTAGMQIRVERTGRDRTYMKVTLREGKNREIRRVFARLGFPVIDLKRTRIGNLSLHGLRSGEWRFLHSGEVRGLLAAASGSADSIEG